MNVQTLDIISVNIWQIGISLANLLILFLIVKKFLFKPIQKVLATRQAQVNELYQDADKSKEAADHLKAEYEAKLSGAKEEAELIVKTAQQNAQRKGDAIVLEASAQASHLKQKAEAEIAMEKKQMLSDVREQISDMAVSIAAKVVEREVKAEDHTRLVDDFIRNVGDQL